jgi:hypothetical protein
MQGDAVCHEQCHAPFFGMTNRVDVIYFMYNICICLFVNKLIMYDGMNSNLSPAINNFLRTKTNKRHRDKIMSQIQCY